MLNYFDNGRYTNAPTEARNRVIKMINRLGAGYSFDAIRARALFGKRPGRVKAEKAAADAALRERLSKCSSCGALFETAIEEVTHFKPIKPTPIDPDQIIPVCADCNRFHTATWFNHVPASTPESE